MIGAAPSSDAAPGIARRLASMLYEGVLLLGVLMLAGLVYSAFTQQRHALQGTFGLQLFIFLVLGIYFVTFWTKGGQTVAMKTWQIRVVTRAGQPLGQWRALARYLLSWLWLLPALVTIKLAQLSGALLIAATMLCGVFAYASLTRLHPSRQYWHDVVCGTQLVRWPARPSANG